MLGCVRPSAGDFLTISLSSWHLPFTRPRPIIALCFCGEGNKTVLFFILSNLLNTFIWRGEAGTPGQPSTLLSSAGWKKEVPVFLRPPFTGLLTHLGPAEAAPPGPAAARPGKMRVRTVGQRPVATGAPSAPLERSGRVLAVRM